jgi:hypothetical protein
VAENRPAATPDHVAAATIEALKDATPTPSSTSPSTIHEATPTPVNPDEAVTTLDAENEEVPIPKADQDAAEIR